MDRHFYRRKAGDRRSSAEEARRRLDPERGRLQAQLDELSPQDPPGQHPLWRAVTFRGWAVGMVVMVLGAVAAALMARALGLS